MDSEKLIQDEADRLCRQLESISHSRTGAIEFKDIVQSAIYHYTESMDKLIFLYRVVSKIEVGYEKHLLTCKYRDTPELCPKNVFYLKCKYFIEQEVKDLNPSFTYSILRPTLDSKSLNQNLIDLEKHPEASRSFQSALDKLSETKFERNLLDDLRLSLESTLKSVLGNDKSLENQIGPLGDYLKKRNTTKEVSNMFRTLIDYYSKYQNDYIKHNDDVKQDEVEFIINLTSVFINFLINKK